MADRALSLTEAAARMNWSRRTLRRALDRAGISPIGRGRLARITEADLAKLIEAMRCHTDSSLPANDAATPPGSSGADARTGKSLRAQRTAQTRRMLNGLRPRSTRGSAPKVLPLQKL